MWKSVYSGGALAKYGDKVCFQLNQVPQPWHPQGTYVHEAALAVRDAAPASYAAYVDAIFTAYDGGAFQDDATWDKSRAQIYEQLLDIAAATGIDRAAVASRLAMGEGGGNSGNAMTQHIKWATKYHRARGVHVTPTVHVNGLEAGIVSSGWSGEQWSAFLEPMGADNWQGTKL